ncbi:hypothetical protein GCM10009601_51410 [Streptomyces thermospinosisporus]|uniref:Uncharacterized protein n=1 Tax=Streptomyces thermospinosisporus TaxID=161482 RepID=A0ABN1Z4P0_9ACTN
MGDLVVWLRAQLDDDERIARATEWCAGTQTFNGWNAAQVDEVDWEIRSRNAVIGSGLGEEFARHIAEHDPARVLREIDAKRRLIGRINTHATVMGWDEIHGDLLRSLALPYADRPGYREEWRP